jgi:hypothetical protein
MRGRVFIEVRSQSGEVLDTRSACNAVMRTGAEILADLFTGKGVPITHMGVGVSDAPESETFTTGALTNSGAGALTGATEVAIAPDAFTIVADATKRLVQVRLRATLPVDAAVGDLREAGLIARNSSGARLYNRVVFPTLPKRGEHELSLFWEVSFPYGDLAGLY